MVENPVPEDLPSQKRKKLKTFFQVFIIALIGKLVLESFLVQAFLIQSNSMENFLVPGDRVLVNRTYCEFGTMNRGDVVLFNSPENREILIKRIIGLPNESISIIDNAVFVNGSKLVEDYLKPVVPDNIYNARVYKFLKPGQKLKIPDDSVFVIGDNRSVSKDSRYFGTISRKNIIGKAAMVIFPPNRMKMI